MATIDPETRRVCLQIVYDGAPFSGKTSSVISLGRLMECPVVTPAEDQGRTVYFDWMDYVGGLCRGRPVQCRIIAVPGQDDLAARRELILSAADAVIFVVDSSAESFDETVQRFQTLTALVEKRRRDVPVLLQINKRDAPDALPIDSILDALGSPDDHIESVAITGQGVRQAFVLAASAGIRALRGSGDLYELGSFDTQEMQLPDPEQLLALLEHA